MRQRLINLLTTTREGYKHRYEKRSFSQCGEDMIVEYVFNLRGIWRPTYLDIGANHPFHLSNTAAFYEKGCRGINVEANSHLMADFKVHRPEDINLNIGISAKAGYLDFYIMEDNTLSTFSRIECEGMVKSGKKLAHTAKVNLTTIDAVLAEHFQGQFPDFLSLDVEGMDFEILGSIDFKKYSPKVICVEAAEYSPIGVGKRRYELVDFLASKGYYEYASTNLNAIMVKNEFWFV